MAAAPKRIKPLAHWQMLIAAASLNPQLVKAMENDIELQWQLLVSSGRAYGIHKDNFLSWSARRRSKAFSRKGRLPGPDDLQLRHKFLQEELEASPNSR